MSQKIFKVNSWLQPISSESAREPIEPTELEESLVPSTEAVNELADSNFNLAGFLIPGWKGESLLGKDALSLKKLIHHLELDAKDQFKSFPTRNKSLKLVVYNEFQSFIKSNKESDNIYELEGYNSFWGHVEDKNSPHAKLIEEFTNIYCFRSVVSYLLKVRFILSLSKRINLKLSSQHIFNPSSVISRVFKRSSSNELFCECLQVNQYSWYRPSSFFHVHLNDVADTFNKISITEMMKVLTYQPLAEGPLNSNDLAFEDKQYSHSLSHKSFGLFVNELLVELPKWLNKVEDMPPLPKLPGVPKAISTKFSGDFLTSTSHSHWLAQEHNVTLFWDSILNPDFVNEDFNDGHFVKICHELLFLTYIVHKSEKQNINVLDFICEVMNSKYRKTKVDDNGQLSMFSAKEVKPTTTYDRILLNLFHYPKKNPHHHLVTNIKNQLSSLNSNGYLYVFSTQNLFIPSQSARVSGLLKDAKVEAFFNFENLKGRGEIPAHLYVISKKNKRATRKVVPSATVEDRESCYSFRISGQLDQFNQFNSIRDELISFFESRNPQSTPIYMRETSQSLFFEFFQDAIWEGQFVNSSPQNMPQITHPNFFKNLTQNSMPIESFFHVEALSPNSINSSSNKASELLGINLRTEQKYPYFLTINYTNQSNVEIELHLGESYRAKVEEYGLAYYQYFGLRPKRDNININILREYFSSPVGRQVIQLSLNSGPTKTRGKLKSLLIPKILAEISYLPEVIQQRLEPLEKTEKEILELHPSVIDSEFANLVSVLERKISTFPWHSLSYLCYFKSTLANVLSEFNKSTPVVNYNNPLIIEKLIQVKPQAIFPNNEDIYIKMLANDVELLQLELSNVVLHQEEDNCYLTLFHGDRPLVELHSDINFLHFIKYILDESHGIAVSSLLQNLKLPSLAEFSQTLTHYQEMQISLENLLERIEALLKNTLLSNLSLS